MTATRRESYRGGVPTGIRRIHRKACPGGRCGCSSYEAWVWDARVGHKLRRTFPSEAAAKAWRADQVVAVTRGILGRSPKQ